MTASTFDWTLVRSFLAALEHGSLLAAARAVGTSQPTLGRHIAELEKQWGIALFERTGRGLVPTQAALRLADAAKVMQGGAEQLLRDLVGQSKDSGGTVRLSASQPVACVLLPPILARMRAALPDIQVELISSNAVSNLLRREADIAVRMVQPDQGSLIAKRIGRVGIGAYAHSSYLARRGVPRDPLELLQHDMVGADRGLDIIRGFGAVGIPLKPSHFAFRTDDLNAYWEGVRAGLGVGFVADYVARQDAQVQRVLPELPIDPLNIWLVVHREIRHSKRIRAVYDFLAQALPAALR